MQQVLHCMLHKAMLNQHMPKLLANQIHHLLAARSAILQLTGAITRSYSSADTRASTGISNRIFKVSCDAQLHPVQADAQPTHAKPLANQMHHLLEAPPSQTMLKFIVAITRSRSQTQSLGHQLAIVTTFIHCDACCLEYYAV